MSLEGQKRLAFILKQNDFVANAACRSKAGHDHHLL